jgi:type II secretory pathway pseudopilin PulG
MTLRLAQANRLAGRGGFTLIEILIAFLIFTMAVGGLIYGYVQANRMAELSSMSLAAQSYASQGMEQARSAEWDSQMWPVTNGPGTGDEIAMFDSAGVNIAQGSAQVLTGHTNYSQVDYLDVPSSGTQIPVTNFITVTNVSGNLSVPLRQIRSDVVWTFPLDGILCTNTMITLRAPDQ